MNQYIIIISQRPEWRVTGGANKGILVAAGLDWDGWSSGHQGRGALVSRHYNFQVFPHKTSILWQK